ncbi:MAG: ABC transporter permease [Candidatus Dadabacteria bacterium]|nr:MAG: ABC transporter permease [Candidatus Dadabacteria bacterium]
MIRVASVILGAWVALALVALAWPDAVVNLDQALALPGSPHCPFGCDALGRPLGRLIAEGALTALIIGTGTVLLAGTAGVVLGAGAALVGGWLEQVVMRITDVLLAFPGILLAIAITAVAGPGRMTIIVALSITGWTGYARLARGETLRLRESAFVEAARVAGAPRAAILYRHILPNLLAPVTVQATFAFAGAVIAESSLSFLGLGDPTAASWGSLLAEGVRHLRAAPHLSVIPGLVISAVVLALNLAGDALTERFDPRRETAAGQPG